MKGWCWVSQHRQAEILLGKADEDMYLMRVVMADAKVSDETWGFHSQQAAEKLFKCLLASRGITFPYTHQISLLTDLLEENGFALDEDFLSLINLTPYAAGLRYSFLDSSQTVRLDRSSILATITRLRNFVPKSF